MTVWLDNKNPFFDYRLKIRGKIFGNIITKISLALHTFLKL
jgi:cytoskeletal protein CcmA (bactofilin family)